LAAAAGLQLGEHLLIRIGADEPQREFLTSHITVLAA